MKHKKIRYSLEVLQNRVLANVKAPVGITDEVDRLLNAIDEVLGDRARSFRLLAHISAGKWAEGVEAGTPVGNPVIYYQTDPRTELRAALDTLDYVLSQAGYPSWDQVRDEWSDVVEEG